MRALLQLYWRRPAGLPGPADADERGAVAVLVGVISDTHGLLRPEVPPALRGVEHILHAGDVGDVSILDALRAIHTVTQLRGTVDLSPPRARLPETALVELG